MFPRVAVLAAIVTAAMTLSLAVETRNASPQGAGQPPVVQTPAGSPAGTGQRAGRSGIGPDDPARTNPEDPTNANADWSPKPPVVARAPEDQIKQFWLPAGYRMEPVLADPLIEDPAQIVFDGNGRMFVVELRGYFQTPEGIDLTPPLGRISMHEDRDNDGTYERHTVFVDKLVFPRFALPFGANSILTMETNQDEVWKYTDTNGDGAADKKELFTTNFGRAGTMESQQSALFWAMDNWLYSTVNAFRLRWTPTGLVKEPTGPNGAQWGVTQDNYGKVWFQGGSSGMPGYFQFPVHYGNFASPGQFEPDLNIIWGAPILVGDIQQGMIGTRMPDGSLIYATAAAGGHVYRGDRLPKDLIGDYLYGEVVGRVVRRLRPVKSEGLTQLRNVYPRSEFIRSLDPFFRPAWITTGPDGTIYIADMYRGIIEGAQWAKEGTYLRKRINQYQLDKVMHRGRIWRLTYDGIPRDRTPPRMLNETPAQLVTHLTHPNGWWRDTAQRLLVLKQDMSAVPALQTLLRTSTNQLARIHALWTLEGLGGLPPALARQILKDPDPVMRIVAIRASETLYKAGDKSFADEYRMLATATALQRRAAPERSGVTGAPRATAKGGPAGQRSPEFDDTDVVIQAMLTLNVLKVADAAPALQSAMDGNKAAGVQFVAGRILNPPASAGRGGGAGAPAFTPDQQNSFERGGAIYTELCFTCHGDDGHGTPAPGGATRSTLAPSLAGAPRVNGHRDYVIKAVLHGLTGPINGKTYSQVMVPMGSNKDQWIADIASFVRNSFGNSGAFVTPADVARARSASGNRQTPWTVDELEASLPHLLAAGPGWVVTASHDARPTPNSNAAGGFNMMNSAASVLNLLGWTTGVPQQPGMWLQVALPEPVRLSELQFTALTAGGGRGGPPAMGTFPREYRVQVSNDGTTWSAPVAEGEGTAGVNTIIFAPVAARFVRITQTATSPDAPPWSMRLLRLYEAPSSAGGGSK